MSDPKKETLVLACVIASRDPAVQELLNVRPPPRPAPEVAPAARDYASVADLRLVVDGSR